MTAAQQVPGASPARRGGMGGRLHPAAIILWPLAQAGPLVILLIAGRLNAAIAIALVAASLAAALVRYLRFSWWVDADTLVIEQGLLQRRRRMIPLDRVQGVELVRPLRHRLLGVVEVRVEAVGGSATEGRLHTLAPDDAERLRALLTGNRAPARSAGARTDDDLAARPAGSPGDPGPSDTGPTDRSTAEDGGGVVLARLGARRLVLAGLTGGRVGVAAALLGGAQELAGERITGLLARAPAALGLRGLGALALLVLLGSFALSIAATAVAYWGFTLVAAGPTLDVRRGLLEQRHDTLPLRRVQALRVEENLARRALGLAAVKFDVAGRADRDEARQTSLLLPLGTRAEAISLVESLLGEFAGVRPRSPALTGMPRRAATRRVTRALALALVPAGLVTVARADWLWALAVLGGLLVPALALALASYRSLGWALGWDGRVLVTRRGVLVRRTAYVPLERIQSLALRASPWQRWRGLASLQVQIARSPGTWSDPRAVDLDARVARDLLAVLARAVALAVGAPVGRRTAELGSPAAGPRSVQPR